MVVNISRSKYGNRKVVLNGYLFDSQAEARRYQELCLLARAGKISELVVHPKFKLVVQGGYGRFACRYTADFQYRQEGELVVEDVKGMKTRDYRMRVGLMKALYGIEVQEVLE